MIRFYRFLGSFFYRRTHKLERRDLPRAVTHVGGVNRIHFEQ
jgi:hypothetical protein